MTTIINTPPSSTEDSSAGLVIGIIFGVLIVVLFLVFGLPYLRGRTYSQVPAPAESNGTTVNVTVPATSPVPTGSATP
jgi:flagellar biogenesis protein FliO